MDLNTACQDCGQDCNIFEVLEDRMTKELELWCYCEMCDLETFHDYNDD